MSSDQAADWLIGTYPIASNDWGEAILLLSHRSWRKAEQRRLASYYFKKLPFSGCRGYEAFASIMSVGLMIFCIKGALAEVSRRDLLLYYLVPVLNRAAKNELDRQRINDLIVEVS
ncbi:MULTISPECIES: hypothetical protein [Pseudomonas fluorescens group]|uniref:hypothetical protein n=1 Tax=Pseudomonas fluorescens group TaxID=136843 RepID=UPI001E470BB7|nr:MULTISPECIES: hypothetical protein [Pseudomonas fluorescens group]MDU9030521.1 hypothetical protein [Pseudomonas mediterranea]UZE01721.1 hypothetical protein LOY71_03570 [Pseudomonas mediterranea]